MSTYEGPYTTHNEFVVTRPYPNDHKVIQVEKPDGTIVFRRDVASIDHVDKEIERLTAVKEFLEYEESLKPWHDAKVGQVWLVMEDTGSQDPYEVQIEPSTGKRVFRRPIGVHKTGSHYLKSEVVTNAKLIYDPEESQ